MTGGARMSEGRMCVVVSLNCQWVMASEQWAGESHLNVSPTHSGQPGTPAQGSSLQRRLKNSFGQAAVKVGLMPLTNEGLKVKEDFLFP